MRILLTTITALLFTSFCFGQSTFYNEYLEEVQGVSSLNDLTKSFNQELVMDFYEIRGESVVEVYIKSTNQLLGIMLDKSKTKFQEVKALKNNKMIAGYFDKYDPEIAVALYQKDISEGMDEHHVESILGEPTDSEMIYNQGAELIEYSYQNGSTVVFQDGKVKNFIAPRF